MAPYLQIVLLLISHGRNAGGCAAQRGPKNIMTPIFDSVNVVIRKSRRHPYLRHVTERTGFLRYALPVFAESWRTCSRSGHGVEDAGGGWRERTVV